MGSIWRHTPRTASLEFDPSSLKRSRHGSITGIIWFDFGGNSFPGAGWSDFAVTVVGWWLDAIREPRVGMVLRFMDGPYLIRARDVDKDAILLDCVENRKTERVVYSSLVQLNDLRSEIIQAAKTVYAECQKRNWSSDEIDRLSRLP